MVHCDSDFNGDGKIDLAGAEFGVVVVLMRCWFWDVVMGAWTGCGSIQQENFLPGPLP